MTFVGIQEKAVFYTFKSMVQETIFSPCYISDTDYNAGKKDHPSLSPLLALVSSSP